METDMVKSIPLFAPVSRRRNELAALADEVDVPAGTQLTRQGGDAREFFVVVEGSADVLRDGRRIGTLWPSDFFGEVGMLSSDWVRSETVVAASPMRLLVLGRREFQTLVAEFPAVAGAIRAKAAMRRVASAAFPALTAGPTSLQSTALVPARRAGASSPIRAARRLLRRPFIGARRPATAD